VNPFALANDKDNKVKIIVDKKMYEAKSLSFHPMQNDALTEISSEDLKKFLKASGKTEIVLDFVQLKKGKTELLTRRI
jgi:Ala-tRNA(Pro) deacylase